MTKKQNPKNPKKPTLKEARAKVLDLQHKVKIQTMQLTKVQNDLEGMTEGRDYLYAEMKERGDQIVYLKHSLNQSEGCANNLEAELSDIRHYLDYYLKESTKHLFNRALSAVIRDIKVKVSNLADRLRHSLYRR